MSKYTPGPWAVFGRAGYTGHKVGDCTAKSIAAFPSTSTRSEDERNANARLIAAAPDMLAVVKIFERYLANNGGDEQFHNADGTGWLTIARAAIAKAEGTS